MKKTSNEDDYLELNYAPVRSDGFYLYDSNKKKVIDFSCSSGNNTLLNTCSIIEKAIIEQLHHGFLFHSGLFLNKKTAELSKRLCNLAGFGNFGTTLFYNSSFEANEYAIKVARTRYNKLCDRNYNEIICFKGSNHDSIISSADIANSSYCFKKATINNIFSVEKLISEHTSAIILETIQYNNGIEACSKEFLQKLRKLCTKHEILLILDETHCGSRRCGTFFAYNRYNIVPDIVTLSHGFCGGFPFSACILNDEASNFAENTINYNTNGNALLYNIADTVTKEINKQDFVKNLHKISKLFTINLNKIAEKYNDIVQSVTIIGLMISIKIRSDIENHRLSEIMLSNGLAVEITKRNNEILLFPPLDINEEQAKKALKIILISIKEISIIENY